MSAQHTLRIASQQHYPNYRKHVNNIQRSYQTDMTCHILHQLTLVCSTCQLACMCISLRQYQVLLLHTCSHSFHQVQLPLGVPFSLACLSRTVHTANNLQAGQALQLASNGCLRFALSDVYRVTEEMCLNRLYMITGLEHCATHWYTSLRSTVMRHWCAALVSMYVQTRRKHLC